MLSTSIIADFLKSHKSIMRSDKKGASQTILKTVEMRAKPNVCKCYVMLLNFGVSLYKIENINAA